MENEETGAVIGYMYRGQGKVFGGRVFPTLQQAVEHSRRSLSQAPGALIEVAEIRLVATVRRKEEPIIVEFV